MSLRTAPDNLNVDDDGVVWIAAHPKLLKFSRTCAIPADAAPTQVLRFDPRRRQARRRRARHRVSPRCTRMTARRFQRGSVAAHWRNEFLVGALLDHKVLICKPNP